MPPPASRGSLWRDLHLDDVSKLIAFAGAILYAALFTAYRTYYDALNLSPEDVGVDPAYVLARSPGPVLLIGTLAAIAWFHFRMQYWQDRHAAGRHSGWRRFASAAAGAAVGIAYALYIAKFFGSSATDLLFAITLVTIVALAVLTSAIRRAKFERLRWIAPYAEPIATLLVAVVVPIILINIQARKLGDLALGGNSVTSFDVAGITVLDVSSPYVWIVWSDPNTPFPPYFGNSEKPAPAGGTLLGQTDNSIVVRIVYSSINPADSKTLPVSGIVRFDSRQVIIQFIHQS